MPPFQVSLIADHSKSCGLHSRDGQFCCDPKANTFSGTYDTLTPMHTGTIGIREGHTVTVDKVLNLLAEKLLTCI